MAGVTVTGAQLRAARALIGMRAEDLARETKVSLRTIRRAEAENGPVTMTAANASALVAELQHRGVRFISTQEGGPGVALKSSSKKN
jgi:hypothetical protein